MHYSGGVFQSSSRDLAHMRCNSVDEEPGSMIDPYRGTAVTQVITSPSLVLSSPLLSSCILFLFYLPLSLPPCPLCSVLPTFLHPTSYVSFPSLVFPLPSSSLTPPLLPTLTIPHTSYSHAQAENILQKLQELIDQSESVILINLDSQHNIMLRRGLQLEMLHEQL